MAHLGFVIWAYVVGWSGILNGQPKIRIKLAVIERHLLITFILRAEFWGQAYIWKSVSSIKR
jgi:hypothetical protein